MPWPPATMASSSRRGAKRGSSAGTVRVASSPARREELPGSARQSKEILQTLQIFGLIVRPLQLFQLIFGIVRQLTAASPTPNTRSHGTFGARLSGIQSRSADSAQGLRLSFAQTRRDGTMNRPL